MNSSATAATLEISPLEAEWRRIAVLAHCLSQTRRGLEISQDALKELQTLQEAVHVQHSRPQTWSSIVTQPLPPEAYDVLALACAPEAEPYLGWTFQSLQAGNAQPYPTPGLIQELLGLDAVGASHLHALLQPDSPLVRANLLQMPDDMYQPIKPVPGVVARLLGRHQAVVMPPGTYQVREKPDWNDLVLPESGLAMLREFLLWVRHRHTVEGVWGGQSCGGPVALFSGPSGTGKTFAAAVLAGALGWDLYRIDLAAIISKYIGETEKNLNRIFDAAAGQSLVLQFDEADSLFGKRAEVKDARDRYANLEVSHLLARIENHQGPCILTTNMRHNVDEAFARRFQTVLEFARPDAAARAQLWRRLLPPMAPKDPALQPDLLGRAANLTGGSIRNAALLAAYLAAERQEPIGLPHIALAVWRELGKDGRKRTTAELGELQAHLPQGGALC